jgi:protein TonB
MSRTKPNRLFYFLIGVSLALHTLIFIHISGLYRSRALSYIELTLEDLSKPFARNIPRPRQRPKERPSVEDVKRIEVAQRPTPVLKPLKIEPADKDLPDSLVEWIGQPSADFTKGVPIAYWNPADLYVGDFSGPQNYLEMVRLRIERYKKYPEAAASRQMEGQVIVRFVITMEGEATDVEVLNTSRRGVLDTAAVAAVKAAAPFPRPPVRFFKGPVRLEIKILFELT